MTDRTFTRLAGMAAMVAMPIAFASFLLGPAAFGWDFNLLFDPVAAIRHPTGSMSLVRLGWMLDIPGYYLLLVPAAVALHIRFVEHYPFATRLAWIGFIIYVLTGTIGAAILAAETIVSDRYRVSDAIAQAALIEIHVATFSIVLDGLWNLLSMSGLVAWSFIAGATLRRDHRVLSIMLQTAGLAASMDVFGHAVGLPTLGESGLFAYLLLFPVFGFCLGLTLYQSANFPMPPASAR